MDKNIEILKKQEDLLQFPHFNHCTAYEFGTFMVSCPDGTNLLNQKWMERKFNTVSMMERSSLLSALTFEQDGDTLESHGLSTIDYALCGGGVPIRIKGNSTVIGTIIASNLYHIAYHEFIINCLKDFLQCPEAPNFPYTLPDK